MKTHDFNLRLDQTPEANLRRLHAYIRRIDRNARPVPKLVHERNMRAMLRLVK